jgi:hypothetical protein
MKSTLPASGVSTLTMNFEVLRPLLRSLPRTAGERIIPGLNAVCLDCGARDKQIMIRKHRKNCPDRAWFRALEALTQMLGPEPSKGRKK